MTATYFAQAKWLFRAGGVQERWVLRFQSATRRARVRSRI